MSTLGQKLGVGLAQVRKVLPWLLGVAALPSAVRLVGDHSTPVGIAFTCVVPLVVPLVLVLTAVAGLLRKRGTAYAGVGVLVLNAVWLAPLWVSDDPPRSGTKVVAMTLNMRYGLAAPSKILEQVRANKVDLLALEELTPEAASALQAEGLNGLLPYQVLSPGDHAHGSGLWSRWPLTRDADWDGEHHMPGATVIIDGRHVVVRVMHPMRTRRFNADTYRRDYRNVTARARALNPATPSILMGDFNAGRDQRAFRTLMGNRWRDAPEVAGSGFTPTWNWWTFVPPMLALDHVLISHQIGATRTATFDAPGSDHHGLLAWLVLTPA